jgi:Holliday junction resolvase RusA-like endonuclease
MGDKVVVEYTIWWPDKRRRDASNLEKLLLDSLEGIAYDDDRWAIPRCVDFSYDKGHPRIDVVCRRKDGAG